VKYLALKSYKTAFKKASSDVELKEILDDLVIASMDKECQELCRKKNCSILRNTTVNGIVGFKLCDFYDELIYRAPLTFKMLGSCKS